MKSIIKHLLAVLIIALVNYLNDINSIQQIILVVGYYAICDLLNTNTKTNENT